MRGRKEVIVTTVAIFVCTAFAHSGFAYPSVYPTGTTIYKPDKCSNGYTLVPHVRGPVLLIDMNGNVVHRWDVSTERARLLRNGHLVIQGDWKGFEAVGEKAITPKMREHLQIKNRENKILEYDWEGNLVWEYETFPRQSRGRPKTANTPGQTHHDLQRLPNGNTIFLYRETPPEEYMKLVKDPERRSLKLIGDCICEVNPKGEVVWEWHEYKHLDIDTYSPFDNLRDWTHTNTVQVLPENHWYDEGYKEFKPGNILTNPRNFDMCMIIDRETKEIVWTYTGDYRGGLAHPHEPHMIEPGLPGAGNILIFDNGLGGRAAHRSGQSFVLEINPVTKEIVWRYENGTNFFSIARARAQRLPNGNTFIDEAHTGRLFEVTPEGEIVWEWITSPFEGSSQRPITNRPERYSYDYCPQLKAQGKPKELAVTPPKYEDWHLLPDALR